MNNAYIVDIVRSPSAKAFRGSFAQKRPDELAADVIKGLLSRFPNIAREEIEDVILGCAMPEGEQGMNVARFALLLAGLPESVPGMTVNRFCSSGLQSMALAADAIRSGRADCILAGGTESMTMIPMGGFKVAPARTIMDSHPDYYLSMGLTAENVARDFGITRLQQDEFAFRSHQLAVKAMEKGYFRDEIIPIPVLARYLGQNAKAESKARIINQDEGPRGDTTLEQLAKLPSVFMQGGSVTAGNTSQMSDGAAMSMMCSEAFLKKHQLKPMARFAGFAVKGVAPRVMGIGPVEAIPAALKQAGLKKTQIERIELNEAFAAQGLAVVKTLELNPEIINPCGGAIALGHPLGATGAKLAATLLYGMRRDQQKWGVVSMCIGTGMGAAGVFELL
jgi:acetyl-CoA acyltransferase